MNYDNVAAVVQPQAQSGTRTERRTPENPIAGVAVVLGLSLGSGVVAGVGALLMCIGLELDTRIALVVAGGAILVVWVLALARFENIVFAVETITGLDLNRDGAIGKTPHVEERIIVANAGVVPKRTPNAPARNTQFAMFVRDLNTRGTGGTVWERELGRDTYRHYRDTLIRLKWARWKSVGARGKVNEKQGWELVLDPDEIVRRLS